MKFDEDKIKFESSRERQSKGIKADNLRFCLDTDSQLDGLARIDDTMVFYH